MFYIDLCNSYSLISVEILLNLIADKLQSKTVNRNKIKLDYLLEFDKALQNRKLRVLTELRVSAKMVELNSLVFVKDAKDFLKPFGFILRKSSIKKPIMNNNLGILHLSLNERLIG